MDEIRYLEIKDLNYSLEMLIAYSLERETNIASLIKENLMKGIVYNSKMLTIYQVVKEYYKTKYDKRRFSKNLNFKSVGFKNLSRICTTG